MNRLLLAAALLIAASVPALAQTTTSRPGQGTGAEQAVNGRVRDFLAALRKGDAEALASLYADDYTATTEAGEVQTKAQRLEWAKAEAGRLSTLDYQDRKVRVYGDTAVVTGLATSQGEGGAVVHRRFTHVWVRQGGRVADGGRAGHRHRPGAAGYAAG